MHKNNEALKVEVRAYREQYGAMGGIDVASSISTLPAWEPPTEAQLAEDELNEAQTRLLAEKAHAEEINAIVQV
jgi:hypothetical protein